MPFDRTGKRLHVGDIVNIPAQVTGLDCHEEFINCALSTLEPIKDGGEKTPLLLNTRQVELLLPLGQSNPDLNVQKAVSDSRIVKG